MKKGPVTGNGLLDLILKGLKLTDELNKATLGRLSQVSKLYSQRLDKQFIWEQALGGDVDKDDNIGFGISAKEIMRINAIVKGLGCEIPASQPRDTQEWEYYTSVPKNIKKSLVALYPIVGPDLLDYVPVLAPSTIALRSLQYWLEALQTLYKTGKEEVDLFHGLFLNNHNFAKRAYDLALRTEISFSTTVLDALADCRFSSLTMNSMELTKLFTELGDFYKAQQTAKKRQYGQAFDGVSYPIDINEIKAFIKKEYIPKSLLWRSKEPSATPIGSQSLPLSAEDDAPSQGRNRALL
jgi:hypothetical protein